MNLIKRVKSINKKTHRIKKIKNKHTGHTRHKRVSKSSKLNKYKSYVSSRVISQLGGVIDNNDIKSLFLTSTSVTNKGVFLPSSPLLSKNLLMNNGIEEQTINETTHSMETAMVALLNIYKDVFAFVNNNGLGRLKEGFLNNLFSEKKFYDNLSLFTQKEENHSYNHLTRIVLNINNNYNSSEQINQLLIYLNTFSRDINVILEKYNTSLSQYDEESNVFKIRKDSETEETLLNTIIELHQRKNEPSIFLRETIGKITEFIDFFINNTSYINIGVIYVVHQLEMMFELEPVKKTILMKKPKTISSKTISGNKSIKVKPGGMYIEIELDDSNFTEYNTAFQSLITKMTERIQIINTSIANIEIEQESFYNGKKTTLFNVFQAVAGKINIKTHQLLYENYHGSFENIIKSKLKGELTTKQITLKKDAVLYKGVSKDKVSRLTLTTDNDTTFSYLAFDPVTAALYSIPREHSAEHKEYVGAEEFISHSKFCENAGYVGEFIVKEDITLLNLKYDKIIEEFTEEIRLIDNMEQYNVVDEKNKVITKEDFEKYFKFMLSYDEKTGEPMRNSYFSDDNNFSRCLCKTTDYKGTIYALNKNGTISSGLSPEISICFPREQLNSGDKNEMRKLYNTCMLFNLEPSIDPLLMALEIE